MKLLKQICLKEYFEKYFCDVCFKFFKKRKFYTFCCGCGCEESIKCCKNCKQSSFVQTGGFCGC